MNPHPREPDLLTRTSEIWREPDLLFVRFLPGADVDLSDARENIDRAAALLEGLRLPVLVDLRPIRSQTAEARAHFASVHTARVARAAALVVGAPVSRVIGNFFLRFNRPEAPTRLFDAEEPARAWLAEVCRADGGGPAR